MLDNAGEIERIVVKQASNTSILKSNFFVNVPVGWVKVVVRATVYKAMYVLLEVLIVNFEFERSKVVKLEAEVGENM